MASGLGIGGINPELGAVFDGEPEPVNPPDPVTGSLSHAAAPSAPTGSKSKSSFRNNEKRLESAVVLDGEAEPVFPPYPVRSSQLPFKATPPVPTRSQSNQSPSAASPVTSLTARPSFSAPKGNFDRFSLNFLG